jgi:hypothetical protein
MTKLPGEGSPDSFEALLQQAYLRAINPDLWEAELPLFERVRQVVQELPGPEEPEQRGEQIIHPLPLKFEQFGMTLLAESPDLNEFAARAGLLFDSRMHPRYTIVKGVSVNERLAEGLAHTVFIGIDGLAAFINKHPRLRNDAINIFLASLEDRRPHIRTQYIHGLHKILATKIKTSKETFRQDYSEGVFHRPEPSEPPEKSGRTGIIADILYQMRYGTRVPKKLGSVALREKLFAPLGPGSLSTLRLVNSSLARQLDQIGRKVPPDDTAEFDLNDREGSFNDGYNMLRRLAGYVGILGSSAATSITHFLPEITQTSSDNRLRPVVLVNELTKMMNEAYFPGAQPKLNKENFDSSLPQAMDRLLYVLRREVRAQGHHRKPEFGHYLATEVLIQLTIDNIYLFLDRDFSKTTISDPVTLADIIVMHPDMPIDQASRLVADAQQRLRRAGGAGTPGSVKVYTYFRNKESRRRLEKWLEK